MVSEGGVLFFETEKNKKKQKKTHYYASFPVKFIFFFLNKAVVDAVHIQQKFICLYLKITSKSVFFF